MIRIKTLSTFPQSAAEEEGGGDHGDDSGEAQKRVFAASAQRTEPEGGRDAFAGWRLSPERFDQAATWVEG